MFCTGSALMAEVHDVSIYSWPVHCRACQLLHPLNPKMPHMKKLQNLGPQDGGNDDSGPLQKTLMGYGERSYYLPKIHY